MTLTPKQKKAAYDKVYRKTYVRPPMKASSKLKIKKWTKENRVRRNARRQEIRSSRYKTDKAYREKLSAYAKHKYRTCSKFRNSIKNSSLKTNYGITLKEVKKMQTRQKNKCALCSVKFGKTRTTSPRVDHCHTTGKVRGLLCNSCNLREGWVAKIGIEKLLEYYRRGE